MLRNLLRTASRNKRRYRNFSSSSSTGEFSDRCSLNVKLTLCRGNYVELIAAKTKKNLPALAVAAAKYHRENSLPGEKPDWYSLACSAMP